MGSSFRRRIRDCSRDVSIGFYSIVSVVMDMLSCSPMSHIHKYWQQTLFSRLDLIGAP